MKIENNFDKRVQVIKASNDEALTTAIRHLTEGKINAVIIKGGLDAKTAAAVTKQLKYLRSAPYEGAEQVHRSGDTLFEAGFNAENRERYYRNAEKNLRYLRSLFPKGEFPIDQLRNMLDVYWDKNVGRLRLEDGLCNMGLCRILHTGGAIPPHDDHAPSDAWYSAIAQYLDVQLTCNWYMNMPEAGGEVKIYPQRLSRNQYDAHRLPKPDNFSVTEDILCDDPILIQPEVADLVIWDARHVHAVAACEGDNPRFTLSVFIGVTRDGELRFFS